jgi:AcrR family transcriptional regulator
MSPSTGSQQRRPDTRPRGRPTVEQAAQLDRDVREQALQQFLEHGYEGTTMSGIARAAGTTKVALYARFPTKEALFSSVLEWATHRPDWPFPEPELPDFEDLEEALTAIATASVRRALDPALIQLGRIAIAQASRFPDIARQTYSASSWRRKDLVVDMLRRHASTGAIVADEPELLAEQFIGMVSAAPARLASFGIVREPAEQEHYIEVAVRMFLRALRPDCEAAASDPDARTAVAGVVATATTSGP